MALNTTRLPRPIRGVQGLSEERRAVADDISRHLITLSFNEFLDHYTSAEWTEEVVQECMGYLRVHRPLLGEGNPIMQTSTDRTAASCLEEGDSQAFTDHVIPSVSASSSTTPPSSLEEGGSQVQSSTTPSSSLKEADPLLSHGNIWTLFPTRRSLSKEIEDQFYQRILVINETITRWWEKEGHERTTSLLFRPARRTTSEIEGASFRSDAVSVRQKYLDSLGPASYNPLYLLWTDSEIPSSEVVALYEWKDDIAKTRENRTQLMGGAAHYMNNDPCRSHILSMTVESYDVTLWYYSRSHCAISETFDLRTEPEPLIRFMLATSFGSDEDLGFSSNIQREVRDGKTCYVFNINGTRYLTADPLREISPLSFCGSALRVFSGWKLGDDNQPDQSKCLVIKDFHDTRQKLKNQQSGDEYATEPKEKVVLDDIKKELCKLKVDLLGFQAQSSWEDYLELYLSQASEPNAQKPDGLADSIWDILKMASNQLDVVKDVFESILHYDDYFITIIASQCTPERFSIRDPGPRETCSPFPVGTPYVQKPSVTGSQRNSNTTKYPNALKNNRLKNCVFPILVRCQVVYEQRCIPLQDIADFGLVKPVIVDAVKASRLLYFIRYVHRDLSPGNIYYDPQTGHGRISDFEYARPYQTVGSGSNVIKTGTQGFMAIDIETGDRIHSRVRGTGETFSHTYLHDLESLFWITLWAFVSRTVTEFEAAAAYDHIEFYSSYFYDTRTRKPFILRYHDEEEISDQLTSLLERSGHLSDTSRKKDHTRLDFVLEAARRDIRNGHYACESYAEWIPHTIFWEVYVNLLTHLQSLDVSGTMHLLNTKQKRKKKQDMDGDMEEEKEQWKMEDDGNREKRKNKVHEEFPRMEYQCRSLLVGLGLAKPLPAKPKPVPDPDPQKAFRSPRAHRSPRAPRSSNATRSPTPSSKSKRPMKSPMRTNLGAPPASAPPATGDDDDAAPPDASPSRPRSVPSSTRHGKRSASVACLDDPAEVPVSGHSVCSGSSGWPPSSSSSDAGKASKRRRTPPH